MRTLPARSRYFPGYLAASFGLLTFGACDGTAMLPSDPEPGAMQPPPPAGYAGTLPTTGRPYRLLRGRGAQRGGDMTTRDLGGELSQADAVCLGERHDSAPDHAVQLLVLERLLGQGGAGRRLATGLEMFQLPVQPILDQYSAGGIDEATLLARTDWHNSWRHDFAFYRPLLERTLAAGGTIRALNIREPLAQKIGRMGLQSLTPEERAELPELDLGSAEHRAWFEKTVAGVTAHGAAAAANLYAAQVARDETMAETAWQWLRSQEPNPRQIAIIAGNGHCMDLAVPARLRRRGSQKVLIVQPVLETAAGIETALAEGYSDVLVVHAPLTLPPGRGR